MKYNLPFLFFFITKSLFAQNDYILQTCGKSYSQWAYYRPIHLDDGSMYTFNLFNDSIEQEGIITDSPSTNNHSRLTHYTNSYKRNWVLDFVNNYGFNVFTSNSKNGRLYIQLYEEQNKDISFDGVHILSSNSEKMIGIYEIDTFGKVNLYKKILSSNNYISQTGNIAYINGFIYAVETVKGNYMINGNNYVSDSNYYSLLLMKLDSDLKYVSHSVLMKSNYSFDYTPGILKAEMQNLYLVTNVTDTLVLANNDTLKSYDIFSFKTRDVLLSHINVGTMQTDWVKRIGGGGSDEINEPRIQSVSNDSSVSLVFSYNSIPFHYDITGVLYPDSNGEAILTYDYNGNLIAHDFIIPFLSDSDYLFTSLYLDSNQKLFLSINNDNSYMLNGVKKIIKNKRTNYLSSLYTKDYLQINSTWKPIINIEQENSLSFYLYSNNFLFLTTGLFYQNSSAKIGTYNYNKCNDFDWANFYMKLLLWKVNNIKDIVEEEKGLIVYPNPTNSGLITLSNLSFQKNEEITIYNTLGQMVHKQTTNQQQTTVNLSHLPKGIYFLWLGDETKKIVIE